VVLTLALLPALLPGLNRGEAAAPPTGAGPGTTATELASAGHPVETGEAGAAGPVVGDILDTLPLTVPPPTTTTTVAPPRPTTTTLPKPKPKVVAPPVTTTTTAPKPAVTVPPIVGNSQSGKATWYEQQPGICAHRSLPFGTVVTVTNTNNGNTATCTVGDRGPFVTGLIIDLAPEEFDLLASRSAGVVPVTIGW